MAVPSLNGIAIPTSMSSKGTYRATRYKEKRTSGSGAVIVDEYVSVLWQFWTLTRADLLWWNETFLNGEPSIQLYAAELWDDQNVAQTYTDGTLYEATYFKYSAGLYRVVSVFIRGLS